MSEWAKSAVFKRGVGSLHVLCSTLILLADCDSSRSNPAISEPKGLTQPIIKSKRTRLTA